MGQPTDVMRLQQFLKAQPNHRAGKVAIRTALRWDADRLARVLVRTAALNSSVSVGPGGRYIRYHGSEVGSSRGVGIYGGVRNAVVEDRARKLLGWRHAEVFHTSRARVPDVWTSPDLVVAAHPLRRARITDRKRLHALEVETLKGFDIRSLYQARGADFAWVFTYIGAATDHRGVLLERVAWTAERLGVGVVGFKLPTNRSTYKLLVRARNLEPSTEDYDVFAKRMTADPAARHKHVSSAMSMAS